MLDTLGRDRFNPPPLDYAPNQRGVDILHIIRRRPVLPTRYIGAYLGTKRYHRDALGWLGRGGYLYHPEDSTHHRDARYRDMWWALTDKGDRFYERWMAEHGQTPEPHRNLNAGFLHAAGCALVGASFDLAAPLGVKYTAYRPKAFSYDGLIPDEPPFSLTYQGAIIDFLGFEFDRNTETMTGAAKTTIDHKLERYNTYLTKKEYEKFGLKTAFVPWITINETHKQNLMRRVEHLVHPKLHNRFLFKVIPDFKSFDQLPPATGHIVTEPWQRIGGSFTILDALEKKWTSIKPDASSTKSKSDNPSLPSSLALPPTSPPPASA